MTEDSHYEAVYVGGRHVGRVHVTKSGKILSVWFKAPYNQLFLPKATVVNNE